MRLNLRLLDPRSGRLDPIVLTADPETPMDEVARALGRVQPGELFVRGVPLSPTGPIRAARLLDGDVVTVTGPEARRAAPTGLELAIVGGPLAGTVWPLLPGTVTIGRSRRADVRVDHPTVSRLHCRIQVEGTSCLVEDLGSTNGTWIGGRPLSEPTVLELGQMFEVGTCPMEVRAPQKADADVHPDEAGGARVQPPGQDPAAPCPGIGRRSRQADGSGCVTVSMDTGRGATRHRRTGHRGLRPFGARVRPHQRGDERLHQHRRPPT